MKKADLQRQPLISKIQANVEVTSAEIAIVGAAISKALLFRAESYVSPSTLMHVVRVLQAAPKNEKKYEVSYPACINLLNRRKVAMDPLCGISNYGYLLSLLEQYGYVYRFYLTYCVDGHAAADTCTKKIKKYGERIVDGKERYLKSLGMKQGGGGGKRTRTKRRRRRNSKKKSAKRK